MRSLMLDNLLTSIADAGRELMTRGRGGARRRPVEALARDLLSTKGEASGLALARELALACGAMERQERLAFFRLLASAFGPDPDRIQAAVEAYRADPGVETRLALRQAAEPPRQELIRRMNMAPGGTRAIVALRARLLELVEDHPELREVEADLHHLLTSWFNPGFLMLTRIDWNSPASLLERLVRYERVHTMQRLEDLRRRLGPDRRCFAFFHPTLPDEPLIFVQVALVQGMADRIQALIDPDAPSAPAAEADTAIFYSISNCQEGLRGVTLGNFLIKLVVASLAVELPHLKTFATLSPLPGFSAWLAEARAGQAEPALTPSEREPLRLLDDPSWPKREDAVEKLRPVLASLAARYLVLAKDRRGRPRDPVARFHLGNGARLERINPLGDLSPRGLAASHGVLVNYRYDPATIERNHEAYAHSSEVARAPSVRGLLPKSAQETAARAMVTASSS